MSEIPITKSFPLTTPQTKSATVLGAAPTTPEQGLRASKFAKEEVDSKDADVKFGAAEGEHDSSSAALASVREPSPNA